MKNGREKSRKKLLLFLTSLLYLCPFPAHTFAESMQAHQRVLGLPDLFAHIHKNHPKLKAARKKFEEKLELYPQARAGWLPTLTAETGIFASNIESSNFSTGTGATTKEIKLDLNQPIWRGGRTFAETDRAKLLIEAARMELHRAEQDILLQAATAYLNVVRDAALLKLFSENEKILQIEHRATLERKNLGDATQTDLEQTKSSLARAKSNTITAKKLLNMSHERLEETLNSPASFSLAPPRVDLNLPDSIQPLLALAEKQNPEIAILRYEQQASSEKVNATRGELFPQISAFASYNRQLDPQPGIVDQSETEMVGMRATLTLFQGGAIRSRLREAQLAASRQMHEIEETRRRIRREVINNWHSYQAAHSQIDAIGEEIAATEAALEGVREEARLGQRTTLDILQADEEVIDARASLIRAQRDKIVSQFAIAKTLGAILAAE